MMDSNNLPSFPTLISFFIFAFMVLNLLMRTAKNFSSTSSNNLPPGPWKLPLLGNIHQIIAGSGNLVHHTFRDLAKKHGPLMYLRIGQVPTIVVSSPEYAKEVMKTHDLIFASRPQSFSSQFVAYGFDDIMFSPHGEYWRRVRKICAQELLSARKIRALRPIREEEMFDLVKWIASNAGEAINLSERILSSTFCITTRVAFGKESRGREEFASVIERSSEMATDFHLPELFPSLSFLASISSAKPEHQRLRREADSILDNIIKEHQVKKSATKSCEAEEDFMDVLLKYHRNDDLGFSLTTNNIKAIIWDIISAGSEASATTATWAMAEMIKNPRIMKRAQQEVREIFRKKGCVGEASTSEMTYLKCIIKETLRLHPPAPLLPKECQEKCEINGYEIPAKTRIMVNAWAIGRDPRYWAEEPESFIPERFLDSWVEYKGTDFEYIPFGAGRRICPGLSLGAINVELQLAFLLHHFDWKLPGGMRHEDLDMTELFRVAMRRKDDLYLIPIPYDPYQTLEKNLKQV